MTNPVAGARICMKRRRLVQGLLLAYPLGASSVLLSPAAARTQGLPLQILDTAEAADLEAVVEAVVPGATNGGIVHFVDQQLAAPPADCLLMLRYLGVSPPYHEFYRAGLAALAIHTEKQFGQRPAQLNAEAMQALISDLLKDVTPHWAAPPASFLYFVWRSDGIDVTYGTPEGMDALGIPYMAHIHPESNW